MSYGRYCKILIKKKKLTQTMLSISYVMLCMLATSFVAKEVNLIRLVFEYFEKMSVCFLSTLVCTECWLWFASWSYPCSLICFKMWD